MASAVRQGLFVAVLVCAGCREPSPLDLCPKGNLGQYQLVTMEPDPQSGFGCLARYREPGGLEASARVVRGQRELIDGTGPPVPFEKHLVRVRPEEGGLRVGWHHGDVGVALLLPGAKEPQGPVLRAYLMHHPSDVVTEVEAARQAIENLREQGRQTPRNAQLHLELARHYRKLGNTIMSAQEYQITVSVDPKSFEAYLELGNLYRDLRHWDLSIRALRKAIALRPGDAGAVVALGDVSFEVHNHDEAVAAYRAALRNGLSGEDRTRVEGRLKELEEGKYLIEELPRARGDGGG